MADDNKPAAPNSNSSLESMLDAAKKTGQVLWDNPTAAIKVGTVGLLGAANFPAGISDRTFALATALKDELTQGESERKSAERRAVKSGKEETYGMGLFKAPPTPPIPAPREKKKGPGENQR